MRHQLDADVLVRTDPSAERLQQQGPFLTFWCPDSATPPWRNWNRQSCLHASESSCSGEVKMGITHSNEAVQRSSTAEDRLRLVIDTIPVQVTRARPDGSLDFNNHRWLEYLGVSVEVVQDWGWTTVTHPEDVERFLRGWRWAMASGETIERTSCYLPGAARRDCLEPLGSTHRAHRSAADGTRRTERPRARRATEGVEFRQGVHQSPTARTPDL